ncbi:MAG: 16S rRNA (guanine(527)-N(7))-methyltransferase RsmG [Gammaproteobacteria bacterium]
MQVTEQQRAQLAQGCVELGLAPSPTQQQKINAYLDGLVKWNKAYNLTAIRDPGEMVIKHLLDSLAIYRSVQGEAVLDVGTGPGLPGIPLAILFPQRRFTLLDSNGKKTRFLVQMKHELQLDNINVINDRIESLSANEQFDCVTCRAFSSLQDFVAHCLHLIRSGGELVAMKGRIPEDEIAALDHSSIALNIEKITVPYLNDERHLIRITRK